VAASASGDLNSHPERPGDLDLWHCNRGSGAECRPWHGQPSCQCWCICDSSLSSYGQNALTLTFDLWGHRACQWCGSSFSIRLPSLKFVDLPFSKIWLIFGRGVNQPGDLDLWPHGSPVTWASFQPIVSFLRPSVLDLRPGMGQTDRQTDVDHQCVMPPPYMGMGHNNGDSHRWKTVSQRFTLLAALRSPTRPLSVPYRIIRWRTFF